MTKKPDLQSWLRYMKAANMVAFDQINSQESMAQARKFCRCLSVGVLLETTDSELWVALACLRQSGFDI